MDRSARSLFSVAALVLAVFLAMNYTVQVVPWSSWWPVLVLVLLAFLPYALGRNRAGQTDDFQSSAIVLPPAPAVVHEVVPAPVVHAPPAPAVVHEAAPVVHTPPAPAPVAAAPVPAAPPAPRAAPPAPVVEQAAPPVPSNAAEKPHVVTETPVAPPQPAAPPQPLVDDSLPPPPAPRVLPDNLTVIEGIGPKMSGALIAAGIDTYAKVAQSSEADLRAAIEAAGMRLAPTMPTWPEQASYAVKGDWDGLKALQATIKGGRQPKK